MKKNIITLFSIAILTISCLGFIHFSNDHVECETISESIKNANSEIVIIEKHICKEKYNF